jgi:hypothetical protein
MIAFDESGNSGANLLDPDQPVFVLASVGLTDDDVAQVLPARSGEYKFAQLRRSASGRRTIVDTLNSRVLTGESFLLSGYHKKFVVVTKMVDLLVEPTMHDRGVDLYERGANLGLANLWYFVLPVFLGRAPFELLLERFSAMIRAPRPETIDKFYRFLDTAHRKHADSTIALDLVGLRASRAVAEEYKDRWGARDLDPAIPSFVMHGSVWTGRLGEPFQIVHDTSKPIESERHILEAMMSETHPQEVIGYDRRKMVFPIKANGIQFRDSQSCRQLQVADLLAGSAAYCLRVRLDGISDDFANDLLQTKALSVPFMPVWPERKFTPEELRTTEVGGIDSADHIGAFISSRLTRAATKG